MTTTVSHADVDRTVARVGRVALATKGVLYIVVGLLATQVARGDGGAEADQQGALESVARQPFGRVLLFMAVVGLLAHVAWRVALAVRGEPGDDEDGSSMAKRAFNVGRAVVYLSLTAAAVRLLTRSPSSGGDDDTQERSTSIVLDLPAGRYLVMAAGAVVIGVGVWNVRKAVTRSFCEDLDLSSLDRSRRRMVDALGVGGFVARGAAFALVGWFLIVAGFRHDPDESRGLDDALRELVATTYGPPLLFALAIGLVLFGAFQLVDARLRRADAVTHA